MDEERPVPSDDARERWLPRASSRRGPDHPDLAAVEHAVVWSRLGRCDHAWAWLDGIDPDGPMAVRADEHRGRVLRELGLHDAAEAVETETLRRASDLVDVVALRLSLAADAAGRGEPDIARSRLEGATALLDELPDRPAVARQRLRRTWVRVEVDAVDGVSPSTRGLPTVGEDGTIIHPPETVHGTDHHRAKGLMFGGVVREDARMLDQAAVLAPPMLKWAVQLARLDMGEPAAGRLAHEAWRRIVPPPGLGNRVAGTATAIRLEALGRD